MSRKPQTNDEEVDAMIKDFMEAEGRLPTIAEIRQILPYGIGNDRASKARRRAEANIQFVGGPPLDEAPGGSDEVCQEDKVSSGSIPTTTEMVRKLLDDVDGEFAAHEAHLRNVIHSKFRIGAHQMLDELLDQLFDRSR